MKEDPPVANTETSPAPRPGDPAPARPARESISTRIKKWMRVGVYASFVCIGVSALCARAAYGDVKRSALDMGRELGQLGDVGSGKPLMLNGQPVYIRSAHVFEPVSKVLDAVEERCEHDSAGLADAFDALPALAKNEVAAKLDGQPASAVIVERGVGRGVVACLVREDGAPARGIADTAARLAKFAATGDLADVGSLRYLYAEATDDGGTHMVSVWTDGSFKLGVFAPPPGQDAPGSDLDAIPRPDKTQRILTAGAEGVPYSVRIYCAAQSRAEVFAFFDRELVARDWKIAFEGTRRVYEKGPVDLFVTASDDGDRSVYSIVVMQDR